MQTRREFLRDSGLAAGGVLGAGWLGGARRAGAAPAGAPNILFVLCDQFRAQSLSCYGDANISTPNMDSLATNGLKFTRCVTNSPVCTPHRSMLQSGRYPARTNQWQNNMRMEGDEVCIADIFGAAGYNTGYIGKWHIDGEEKPGPVHYRQGWQYWAGFNRGHRYNPGTGYYYTWSGGVYTEHRVPSGVYEPDHQTDLAVGYINHQNAGTPWFLTLSWGPPHTPFGQVAQSYKDMFDPSSPSWDWRPNVSTPDLTEVQGYYAQIKALDDYLARLLNALDARGFTDNTMVLLTADHGEMIWSQGTTRKGKPYEESILVPLLVRWPNGIVDPGRAVDALFGTVDFLPTLCGLAGITAPAGKDGADLSHLFFNMPGREAGSVCIMIGNPGAGSPWRGVRTRDYTYALHPKDAGFSGSWTCLYDNEKDPYQLTNQWGDAGHAQVQERLHNLLLYWLHRADDPLRGYLAEVDPGEPGTPIALVNADFAQTGASLDAIPGWDPAPGCDQADARTNSTQGLNGTPCGVLMQDGGMLQLSDHSIQANKTYVFSAWCRYVNEPKNLEAVIYYDDAGTPKALATETWVLAGGYTQHRVCFDSGGSGPHIGKKIGVYFKRFSDGLSTVARADDVTLEYGGTAPGLSPGAVAVGDSNFNSLIDPLPTSPSPGAWHVMADTMGNGGALIRSTGGRSNGACGEVKRGGTLAQQTSHDILPNRIYMLSFWGSWVASQGLTDVTAIIYYDDTGTPVPLLSRKIPLTRHPGDTGSGDGYHQHPVWVEVPDDSPAVGKPLGIAFAHATDVDHVLRLDDVTIEQMPIPATAPAADTEPAGLTFPARMPRSGPSDPLTVDLCNWGSAELQIVSISIVDIQRYFTFHETPSTDNLPPWERRPIRIVYNPQSPGAHAAELRIDTNDPLNTVLTIPLSGTATATAVRAGRWERYR